MQSNNPVFRNSEEFNRPRGQAAYSDPSTWSTGAGTGYAEPGYAPVPTHTDPRTGPMTIDSVVQKTGIALVIVIAAAIATWALTPDIRNDGAIGPLGAALTIGSLTAFALSMVNSFKRVVSPALVVAFCVAEGITLGAFSKLIDAAYEYDGGHGLVTGAVIGTFAAFGGTLTAYKVLDIKVGQRFRTFVVAAVFGMVGLSLMELVLGLFGDSLGLFGFGGLGLLTAIAGLVLGIFMLILDFDFVEQGIANRIPERESWRAAFAMTVSLVWIYTNLLRLLAIFSDN